VSGSRRTTTKRWLRLRDFLLSPRTLWALAFWVAAFVVLDLVDVILAVQLAAAAVYAAFDTARERQRARERHRAAVAEGMDPLQPDRRLRWWLYGSLFAGQAGFLAAACFLASAAVG
jgi:ABC-type siderophore export system fused ATPase/permease subunit